MALCENDRRVRGAAQCFFSATVRPLRLSARDTLITPLDVCDAADTFPIAMAPPIGRPDDELDLPPLDGEGDEPIPVPDDEIEAADDRGDPFDDSTEESVSRGAHADSELPQERESGWLLDGEASSTLDVGAFDLSLGGDDGDFTDAAEVVAAPDEDDPWKSPAGDLDIVEDGPSIDGGEEGPLDEDEELREEDLPALDADEQGDVEDQALFDRAALSSIEDLRWDDRAWTRTSAPAPQDEDEAPVPGVDPTLAERDATWRRLEESGRLSCAALVPGSSVVVAIEEHSRAVLVRIRPDGEARIIAEIEGPSASDDANRVTALRWIDTAGCLVATCGSESQAFRPA